MIRELAKNKTLLSIQIMLRKIKAGDYRVATGQGKVREFCNWSGKFGILRKVREIQEKSLVNQGNLTFSCLTRNNAAMPRIRKKC